MTEATNGIANLIQNATQMAPLMLVGGYVTIGLAIVSAVQARKQKNATPYPKIFEMLAIVSKKLDDLKLDIIPNPGSGDSGQG